MKMDNFSLKGSYSLTKEKWGCEKMVSVEEIRKVIIIDGNSFFLVK